MEQIFSRAGGLTDPNIDQDYLATLVVVGCNKSAFKPSCDAIKAKYYQLFCGRGGEGLEVETRGGLRGGRSRRGELVTQLRILSLEFRGAV